MKKTLTEHDFCDDFRLAERKDTFSYAARRALFAYFEQLEEETGQELELDVIAICCEFAEYATARDAVREYDNIYTIDGEDMLDQEHNALCWLQDQTTVIPFDDGILVMSF